MSQENRNLRPPNKGIDDFLNEDHTRQGRVDQHADSRPTPVPPPPVQTGAARSPNGDVPTDEIQPLRDAAQQRHPLTIEGHDSLVVAVLSPAVPAPARSNESGLGTPDLNLRAPLHDTPDLPLETATPRSSRADQPGRTLQWDDPLPTAAAPSIPIEPQSRAPQVLAAAFLIAAVAVGGYFVFRNRGATPPASAPATAAPSSAPAEAVSPLGADVPPIDLPPLNDSDEVVRQLVKELSSHPSVAAWLATDDLIRNFTVVVTNIASGEPATTRLTALRPRTRFQANDQGPDPTIDSRSYARYLPLATATTSLNPDGAARLYSMLKPRIEEAYAELGLPPDRTFDQTLERAIVLLLRTPVPPGQIGIEPNGPVIYRFADPALEKLTPSQKLLIRLGPDNQRAVQTSLRNIALALGIPADRLP
jgi:hypothetical protein